MIDNKGQVSLEYLLIFAISLILLIAFTLPTVDLTIKDSLDVSDSLDAKSDLSKIAQVIQQVYGEGQGSKHSVNIDSPRAINLNVGGSYVSCNFKLNDNSNKYVRVNVNSNLEVSSISLNKGENLIIVEWPENAENMIIYKK